jgi:peptide/nickel transport system ATP-binding protein
MSLLLDIQDLVVHYKIKTGWVHAVDGVTLRMDRGETLGLVGESACGKTTLAYGISQLLPNNAYIKGGRIMFDGRNLLAITMRRDGRLREYEPKLNRIRWKEISMIFQGAMNALNPVHRVGDQIVEAIVYHEKVTKQQARKRVEQLYDLVGVPKDRIDHYPHEYSGGMKQRAMIAMALALNPKLVIADEPTTALDVITQSKVLGRIKDLQNQLDMAMIIITHDVSVVAKTAKRIAVMYAGQISENGTTRQVFKETAHPYTSGLLGSFPSIKGKVRRLTTVRGNPPSLVEPPTGCRFHPRCPYAKDICKTEQPSAVAMGEQHVSFCHFAKDLTGTLSPEAVE